MKKNKLYSVTSSNRNAFNSYALGGWADLALDAQIKGMKGLEGLSGDKLTDAYMGSKNIFGLTKAANPFSKGNIAGGAKAMASTPIGGALLTAGSGIVGNAAYKGISGGLDSGAGSAINSLGSTAGGVVGTFNPLLGDGITVGSGLVGGGINALWGTKTNQAALRAANEGTSYLNNFTSNAGSFDEIQGPAAMSAVQNAYSGGIFKKKWARRKNEELRKQRAAALAWANRSVDNNIDNLIDDQMNNALASYAAYGGPLGFGTGALGLMQQNRYFDSIDKRSDAIMRNNMDSTGLGTYAFGGELGTNGTDFTNGLLEINAGGSHEENPLEGVPMGMDAEGTPNLVEEGETVYNDYVFSDRMMVPKSLYHELGLGGAVKKGISFADASKKLAKESEQRPNDPISIDGLEASLSKLAAVQEAERMKKQMEEYATGLQEYACGGKMKKYGLGGNLFAGGGKRYAGNEKLAANYLRKHFPNATDKEIEAQAKIMADYAYDHNYGYVGSQGKAMPRHPVKDWQWDKIAEEALTLSGNGGIGNGIAGLVGNQKSTSNVTPTKTKGKTTYYKANDGKVYKNLEEARAVNEKLKATQPETETPIRPSAVASKAAQREGFVPETSVVNQPVAELTPEEIATRAAIEGSNDGVSDRQRYYPTAEQFAQGDGSDQYKAYQEWMRGLMGEPSSTNIMGVAAQQQTGLGEFAEDKIKNYPTWMRYAPVVGAGAMAITDALGLTNKPDYTYADKLEAAAQSAGYAPQIGYKPVGDYLTYKPFDRLFYANQLQANARATDRALSNTVSPSKAAGLLANGYNTTNALGNLYRQAEEYNQAQRQQVADFNRKTNMFNSQMGLEASMANARYRQQASQMGLSGLAQAAALRDTIDQRMGDAKAANLNNLLTSLGNIGRENFAINQINTDAGWQYGTDASGRQKWKGEKRKCGGKMSNRKK